MRMTLFVLAAFFASTPALAQGWEEYAYPDYAFAVAFPGKPQVEKTTFQIAPGRSVPAQVYSVRQNNVVLKATVADLANTNLEESALIDQAIKVLSEGGTVNVNIPARIYRVYGRHVTSEWADGSRSMAQLFYYQGRLYLIEVKDGRKEEPEFRMRLKEDLFIEVGQKVRDSLAGLVGKLHMAFNEELWGRFREAILRRPVTVVLWLELHHGPRGPSAVDELKAEAATREEQLRTRVYWLTRRTIVTSTRMGPRPDLPGLKVTNLAGAGQPNPP